MNVIEAAKVIHEFCECHSCFECPAWRLRDLGFDDRMVCEFRFTPVTWGDWIKEVEKI